MLNIDELKFDEKGLIPAIVVDSITKQVLTLAYMNKESLQISMEKGLTCFWSRSRQELWLKGETSGNYQHIVSIEADCDNDALVVKVEPDGPAAKADLRLGDILIAVDGDPITGKEDFQSKMESLLPGHPLQLTIYREDGEITVPLTPTTPYIRI